MRFTKSVLLLSTLGLLGSAEALMAIARKPVPLKKNQSRPFQLSVAPLIGVRHIDSVSFSKNNVNGVGSTIPIITESGPLNMVRTGSALDCGWKNLFLFQGQSAYHFGVGSYMHKSAQNGAQRTRQERFEQFDTEASFTGYIPMGRHSYLSIQSGGRLIYSTIDARRNDDFKRIPIGRLTTYTGFIGLGWRWTAKKANRWTFDAKLNYHLPGGVGHTRTPGSAGQNEAGPWLDRTQYKSARFGLEGIVSGEWNFSKKGAGWSGRLTARNISLSARGTSFQSPPPFNPDVSLESASEIMKVLFSSADFALIYTF